MVANLILASEVFDSTALRHALTALAQAERDSSKLKSAVLAKLKQTLGDARADIKTKFEAGGTGLAAAQALSRVQDQLIAVLYDFTVKHVFYAQNPTESEHLAIVAVGGYGRGALAPGSDIDLLFLLPYKQTAWGESVVEYMLYMLWDLGLKVGHATRSLNECIRLAKSDMTIRTAVLEARYLWGERKLFDTLKLRFAKEVVTGSGADFVEAKLQERHARHVAAGESRYLVEPNVKDGKGGLRDLHTLFWIAKYLYRVEDTSDLVSAGLLTDDEYRTFSEAEAFLWDVRCHLHYLTGRAEERLSFDVQMELARRMGFTDEGRMRGVERFMKQYFLIAKSVGDLTRIFCAALEAQQKKPWPMLGRIIPGLARRRLEAEGFFTEQGRLSVEGPEIFQSDPVNLLRLFHIADQRGLDIHPDALKFVTRALPLIDDALRANAEANRLFLEVLTSRRDPERVLRMMNEAGVFGAFVPDFGRIVAQMQFNMYHHYTVDEHLIRAVGHLAKIERGEYAAEHPLANEIIHKVLSREVLYVAMLLHDIAKGREGDHSTVGENVALELCPRLGMKPEETETVAWLVLNHLVMSDVAQKRDVSDPKTIRDFVAIVQSPERLRLLLCLTVADIRAVGPGVWNGWKGQLLRQLYYEAEAQMLGGFSATARPTLIAQAKAELERRLVDWPEDIRARALSRHYDPYWLTLTADQHEQLARQMRNAEASEVKLSLIAQPDSFRSVTDVSIFTADHPGLFSQLTGAVAMSGANIVDAKIFTTSDGMAVDIFSVQDSGGRPLSDERRIDRMRETIKRVLSGEIVPRTVIDARHVRRREEAFHVQPRVLVDNSASDTYTVIEVNGRDRPGLLHDLTRALFVAGLSIHSAQIATYGERAVDVFYVKDGFGLKVTQAQRLQAIRERILEALGDGGPRAKRKPRAKVQSEAAK
ncbi:MAG: [protein-PII] uridylyltransferase [Alphaproteobacteria bacterium]|nr:[protein-PII] uridylyltransferase [Alphaproteobacteria bacterium]